MRLATKTSLVVTLVAITAATLTAIATWLRTASIVQSQIQDQQAAELHLVQTHLAATAADIRRAAEVIGLNPRIQQSLNLEVSRGVSQTLNRLTRIYPFYNYIIIGDLDGYVFAANTVNGPGQRIAGEELLGLEYRNHPLFASLQDQRGMAGTPGDDPYLAKLGLEPTLCQWFEAPVVVSGRTIGVAIVCYNWQAEVTKTLTALRTQMMADNKLATDLALTKADGEVIAGTLPPGARFQTELGPIITETMLIGQNSYRLSLQFDQAKLMAPLLQMRKVVIICSLFSILLLIVSLTWALDRAILRRLGALHDSTSQLAAGNLSHRVGELGYDEIGRLGETFDTMATNLEQNLVELRQHQDRLELRVAERTEELTKANQSLEEFAYIVSHDLKAPLRGIYNVAEWMAEDYTDLLDEDGRENLVLMRQRVSRLNDLIDGILDYSRIGRSTVHPTKVAFGEVVQEVVDSLSPIPEHIQLTVAQNLPSLYTVRTYIYQLFLNLLSNALRYADPSSGKITITHAVQDGQHLFSVTDNGTGVDPEHHDRIFKIFQTLQEPGESGSTGVGLSIVRRIVELHNGKIWLDSTLPNGASFQWTMNDLEPNEPASPDNTQRP